MSYGPSTTTPTPTASILVNLINDEASSVVICAPVYSDAPGGFKKALGDGTAKATVVGVVMDESVPSTKSGAVLRIGVVTASTAQWDAVCGTSGGLTYGALYYLSTTLAGRLVTSSASGVPVIFGLGPGIGVIVTGSSGGGGSVGPGTTNKLPKFTGTSTVGDSGITDDGSNVIMTARGLQVGADPVNAGQAVMITKAASATTTQVWIEEHDTGHQGDTTELLGGCEAINLVLRQNAQFNTTAASATANASCIDLAVTAAKTSGAQPLTNTGILIQSANGDTNYAINILSGILKSVAAVDFSGAVSLGNNVSNFGIPGSTSTVARVGIGALPAVDGTGIQVKNTVTASTLTGMEVGLDTTVNAGIRGGYLIFRGAGGNFGGNSAGMVIAGGAGFPFGSSAANELAIFSENSTPITFGGDSSGFTKGMSLETNNQLRVAKDIQLGSLSASSGMLVTSNAGSPEGVVTAGPGSYCGDTTNGEGYIKKTGTGNTGWKLVTHA